MGDFSSLLFEFSSVDRLNILKLLRKKSMKLSHISKKLDFTVQETSRNISRLSNAKLIAKNVDGTFSLTSYGEAAFNLLSGFHALYENSSYFLFHNLSKLPKQFRDCLGILEEFKLVDDVMIMFNNIERMIATSEEFVWIISDQVLASTIPYLVEALKRGVEFRLLLPKKFLPTDNMRKLVDNPVFEKASKTGKLDVRFLDEVNVFLCLSENEISALAFLDNSNKLDYRGFKSIRDSAIDWSKMLYSYYWTKASAQTPDQLLR